MMKPGYLVQGAFLAAALSFNLTAYAQPVNLTCKIDQGTWNARVTFDESAQTAGYADGESGDVPAYSATFTDTEIEWDEGRHFTLSRTTGRLEKHGIGKESNVYWNCTVAEKKF